MLHYSSEYFLLNYSLLHPHILLNICYFTVQDFIYFTKSQLSSLFTVDLSLCWLLSPLTSITVKQNSILFSNNSKRTWYALRFILWPFGLLMDLPLSFAKAEGGWTDDHDVHADLHRLGRPSQPEQHVLRLLPPDKREQHAGVCNQSETQRPVWVTH